MNKYGGLAGVLLLVLVVASGTALPQTAVTVYEIAPGVSLLGAGGTGLAVTGNPETLYYNAAGLASMGGISFSSFYSSHLGLANYSAFSLTFRNAGVALLLLGSGNIDGYDSSGNPTGTLSYRNTGFLFGFGASPDTLSFLPRLPIDYAVGARLKAVTARLGDGSGAGFAFDLGAQAMLADMSLGGVSITDITFGLVLGNLFGTMSYDTTQEAFLMEFRMGASALFLDMVRAAVDMNLSGSVNVGLAYQPVPTLELRLGVISQGPTSITAGIGVNVEGVLIDYAYASHPLGGSHRVSLTLDFSALDVASLTNSLRRILP